ncbi:NUDIX hydrolase, core domain protein [mine drainage metagenome]|uniref:NUDIX hydrolase, core domain protein n=1 Tax=mine drainage metagenome TaxID=410659 RepID=T0Y4U1_9ZZZZ
MEAYLVAGEPRNVLLLKRTEARGGFWQPVSGRWEPRDGDLGATVRREVQEETGFRPLHHLTDLQWSFAFPGRDGRTWRVHAFAAELRGRAAPVLSDEHTAFQWLPLGQALTRLAWEDNREALRRLAFRLPLGAGRDPR